MAAGQAAISIRCLLTNEEGVITLNNEIETGNSEETKYMLSSRAAQKGKHLLFLILISLSMYPNHLLANGIIQWGRLDFPPFEISAGSFKNKGIVDVFRGIVERGLVNYKHEDAGLMTYTRLKVLLKTDTICHGALMRTPEIEELSYLSVGIGIMPSHALLTSMENYKATFNHQNMISLQHIIKMENIILGAQSRTMGPVIDSIIEKHKNQKNILIRNVPTINGLFKMLFHKRLDYIVGYPAEAMFWNEQKPQDRQLAVIPFKETAGQYTIGRLACSRNEEGKKIIKRANKIISNQRMKDDFIDSVYLQWIPENMKSNYLEDYKRISPRTTGAALSKE